LTIGGAIYYNEPEKLRKTRKISGKRRELDEMSILWKRKYESGGFKTGGGFQFHSAQKTV